MPEGRIWQETLLYPIRVPNAESKVIDKQRTDEELHGYLNELTVILPEVPNLTRFDASHIIYQHHIRGPLYSAWPARYFFFA